MKNSEKMQSSPNYNNKSEHKKHKVDFNDRHTVEKRTALQLE